jgi:hydrogenase maturation protease
LSAIAPVLLLAIGNESRGDDGLGPLLLRRLGVWLDANGLGGQVELIEEFQLQIENTLDLKGRELVLFIDAGKDTPAPYRFYQAVNKRLEGHTTHVVAPETLLGVYAMVHGEEPPLAYILCIRGEQFELGEPLSAQAQQRLDEAFEFSCRLLENANSRGWALASAEAR